MALVLKQISNYYIEFEKMSDPRLAGSYLTSPLPVCILTAVYYYFTFYAGPKFMVNRRPYDLKKSLIIYNFLQVHLNAVVFYKAVLLLSNFFHLCIPLDYSETPMALEIFQYAHYYYYLKIADYMDTIFFVLRKKYTQVTFLHVYHHILMVIFGWIGLKIAAGSHTYYIVLLNSFVHTAMYLYYLLAALESTKAYVSPYKKYVTQLQLCQFIGLTAMLFVASLQPQSCTVPKFLLYLGGTQNFFMIWLFSNFYYKTYIKPSKPKTH